MSTILSSSPYYSASILVTFSLQICKITPTNNQHPYTNQPMEKDQDLRPCGVKRIIMTGQVALAPNPALPTDQPLRGSQCKTSRNRPVAINALTWTSSPKRPTATRQLAQNKPQRHHDYKCFDMDFIPLKTKNYAVASTTQAICTRAITDYLLFWPSVGFDVWLFDFLPNKYHFVPNNHTPYYIYACAGAPLCLP